MGATHVGFRGDGSWWRIVTGTTDPVVCYLLNEVDGTEIKIPRHWPVADAR